jgi:hypothetical protein
MIGCARYYGRNTVRKVTANGRIQAVSFDLGMTIDWVSPSGRSSLATTKVKLHSLPPPTTTTYYYWKKNIQKIHKFQQRANPDENEG